jgi:nucleotide-binding universal stress UspA family protein
MTPVIAHTTDLSGDDEAAFLHACALAATSGARLLTIHGNPASGAHARLPDAAPLAARWSRPIEQDRICHECCDDVADTVVDAIRRAQPALVVTGTHARHGVAAVFAGSIAEAVARNARVPTLIVPNHGRGFVDAATGAIDLRRVLIPAGGGRDASEGLAAARALVELCSAPDVELELLHVGPVDWSVGFPETPSLRVRLRHAEDPVEAILVEARAMAACVIVMPTHGHDGLVDALRGSRTERVMRDAPCPLLSVPIRERG